MLVGELSPNTTFQQQKSKKALPKINKTIEENMNKSTSLFTNQNSTTDQTNDGDKSRKTIIKRQLKDNYKTHYGVSFNPYLKSENRRNVSDHDLQKTEIKPSESKTEIKPSES